MAKRKLTYVIFMFCFLAFNGIVDSFLFAQDKQEITVTIEYVTSEEKLVHFNQGEDLRKQFRFNDAITDYEQVLTGSEKSGKEPEACYNIGLCYCWLNDFENARFYFTKVINEYKTEPLVVSFSQYGLSWIKEQEGKYYEAIEILERELNSKNCSDYEHNAVMLFKIGKIYQNDLLDFDKAQEVYRRLIAEYPKAKIINHSFLNNLK